MSISVLNEDLDVETLRNAYESGAEWTLRRAFLNTHRDKLPLSRLQSLSCCLINTELYGNTYSENLMEQLGDLISDLPEECKQFIKKLREEKKVVFVPSGERSLSQQTNFNRDLSESFVKDNSNFRSTDVAFCRRGIGMSNTVYNIDSDSDDDGFRLEQQDSFIQDTLVQEQQDSFMQDTPVHEQQYSYIQETPVQSSNYEYNILIGKLVKEFKGLKSLELNFISQLHCAADNLQIDLELTQCDKRTVKNGLSYFKSELRIDSILFTTGEGLSKKSSKWETYTIAIEKLCSLCVNGPRTEISQGPFSESAEEKNTDLAICASKVIESEQTRSLPTAAKPVEQVTELHGLSEFVLIESLQSGWSSVWILRESAKFNEMSLRFLVDHLYSRIFCKIFLDGHPIDESDGRTKGIAKEKASSKALQKLRLHCWTILRKPASGNVKNITRQDLMENVDKIDEPISVHNEGHTNSGCNIDFVSNVQTVLKDYSLSSNPDRLTFEGQFFKPEKRMILRESHRLDLSVIQNGSKVIVSHNWTAHQLLSKLMGCGGSSCDYTLLPPGIKHQSNKVSNHDIGTEPNEELTSEDVDQDLSFENYDEDLTCTDVKEDSACSMVKLEPFSKRTEKQNTDLAIDASMEIETKQAQSSMEAPKPGEQITDIPGLSEFVLIERGKPMTNRKAYPILQKSSKLSKTPLQFVLNRKDSGFLCEILLDGHLLQECTGPSVKVSRELASSKALEKLHLNCWTIFKKFGGGKESNITREDLMRNVYKKAEPISIDSFGNKLLQKMGLKGGGIEKDSNNDIVETISVHNSGDIHPLENRTSFDNQDGNGCGLDFASKVQTVLKHYSISSNPDSLNFLCTSSPEERAVWRASIKHGLTAKRKGSIRSNGTAEVIVSQAWKSNQLLSVLKERGGSSRDYRILPPSLKHQSNHDKGNESHEDFFANVEDLTAANIDEDLTSSNVEVDSEDELDCKEMQFSKSLIYTNSTLTSVDPYLHSQELKLATRQNQTNVERFIQETNCSNVGTETASKEGTIESTPVPSVISKKYLGMSKIDNDIKKNFRQKVQTYLMEYSKSANQNELLFSTEFNSKDRAVISKESHKLGLISHGDIFSHKPVVTVYKAYLSDREENQLQMIKMADLGLTPGENGYNIIKADIPQKVKAVLVNFMKSTSQIELTFSAEFGRKERVMIHQEAEKLGLIYGTFFGLASVSKPRNPEHLPSC